MYQDCTSSSEEASLLLLDSALQKKKEHTRGKMQVLFSNLITLPSIYLHGWIWSRVRTKKHTGERKCSYFPNLTTSIYLYISSWLDLIKSPEHQNLEWNLSPLSLILYIYFSQKPKSKPSPMKTEIKILLTNIWMLIISAFWQTISTRKCKLLMLQQQQQQQTLAPNPLPVYTE